MDYGIVDYNIFDIQEKINDHHSVKFMPAFCIDSGAQRNDIGIDPERKIENQFQINDQKCPYYLSFIFGDEVFLSIGPV